MQAGVGHLLGSDHERDFAVSYSHALIFGGTGMLLEASSSVAPSARRATFVANRAGSEQRLVERLGDKSGWQLFLLDWKQSGMFLDRLEAHLKRLPPVDLVLGWFHDPGLAPQIAGRIQVRRGCKFVHVIGSATRNPADLAISSAERFTHLPQFDYRQVLLGYMRDGAHPRWLTDLEICGGVLDAMSSSEKRVIVGQISDWERRP